MFGEPCRKTASSAVPGLLLPLLRGRGGAGGALRHVPGLPQEPHRLHGQVPEGPGLAFPALVSRSGRKSGRWQPSTYGKRGNKGTDVTDLAYFPFGSTHVLWLEESRNPVAVRLVYVRGKGIHYI